MFISGVNSPEPVSGVFEIKAYTRFKLHELFIYAYHHAYVCILNKTKQKNVYTEMVVFVRFVLLPDIRATESTRVSGMNV